MQRCDGFVIFGITGDLAQKMTFLALYRLEAAGRLDGPIIGVAIEDYSQDQVVALAQKALANAGQEIDASIFDRWAARFTYLSGNFTEPSTYEKLVALLKGVERPLYYLEIPPALFAPVVVELGKANLVTDATVMIEKPFGHDFASAQELNRELHKVLKETQILRIDHFLGKQPVLDIHFLRFANEILEPVWNRDHVKAIQVTLAEDFGVDGRGAFYDVVGALRDVVQNHLLQVLALIAMEPPASAAPDAISDKKIELFRAMSDVDPAQCVRGQYEGYLKVEGVKPDSITETYVALQLAITNERWDGVPFFVRAGKALRVRSTEVRVIFAHPPRLAILDEPAHADSEQSNQIVFRIDPDAGLRFQLLSKDSDGETSRQIDMDLDFADELGKPPEPYERLIHDALTGDRSRFTREDTIEETWRVLQPLVENPPPLTRYAEGSWGPPLAAELLKGHPPWQEPWLHPAEKIQNKEGGQRNGDK
jgi:glucose-6-phosphate 1-dehydrogenase